MCSQAPSTDQPLSPRFADAYAQLRAAAQARLRAHPPETSLRATELVHEAFMKLAESDVSLRSSGHLLAAVSQAMRWIIMDRARRRLAERRGGGRRPVPLGSQHRAEEESPEDLLALGEALEALERRRPRLCRVVELRYFAGASIAETAEALGVSEMTVKRDWITARALLLDALDPDKREGGTS